MTKCCIIGDFNMWPILCNIQGAWPSVEGSRIFICKMRFSSCNKLYNNCITVNLAVFVTVMKKWMIKITDISQCYIVIQTHSTCMSVSLFQFKGQLSNLISNK